MFEIHGRMIINIKFGDAAYRQTVYIADISDTFMLELDFLKEHGFTLDFKKNELRSAEKISVKLEMIPNPFDRLQIRQIFTISRRTKIMIPGITEEDRSFHCGLVEYPEKSPEEVLIASALVDVFRNIISEKIVNGREKSRIIQKRKVIATCNPVPGICKDSSMISLKPLQKITSEILENENLPSGQRSVSERLFCEFKDVFSQNEKNISLTSLTRHRIDTADPLLVKQHTRALAIR